MLMLNWDLWGMAAGHCHELTYSTNCRKLKSRDLLRCLEYNSPLSTTHCSKQTLISDFIARTLLCNWLGRKEEKKNAQVLR